MNGWMNDGRTDRAEYMCVLSSGRTFLIFKRQQFKNHVNFKFICLHAVYIRPFDRNEIGS